MRGLHICSIPKRKKKKSALIEGFKEEARSSGAKTGFFRGAIKRYVTGSWDGEKTVNALVEESDY